MEEENEGHHLLTYIRKLLVLLSKAPLEMCILEGLSVAVHGGSSGSRLAVSWAFPGTDRESRCGYPVRQKIGGSEIGVEDQKRTIVCPTRAAASRSGVPLKYRRG